MGELDILLAKEFSKRHGLYDKKSPNFKDRVYNDNAWKEIAAKLGYNVEILKDRMLQLRNRYNVEKRKYESLCAKYPNSKAQWPLYYHLNFLDGHIRPRRQYRTMNDVGNYSGSLRLHPQEIVHVTPSPPPLIKAPTAQINPVARRRGRPPKKFVYPPEYCNNGDSPKPTPQLQRMGKQEYIQMEEAPVNSDEEEASKIDQEEEEDETDEVLVKCEVISNSEEGDEEQENSGGEFINPVNLLAQTASPEENTRNTDEAEPIHNTEEYEQPTQSNTSNNNNNNNHHHPSNNTTQNASSSWSSSSPIRVVNNHITATTTNNNDTVSTKKRRNDELILKLHRSPCKYQAFGQFVAASLSELADDRALNLIEKFTIQIVSSMRQNQHGTTVQGDKQ